MARDARNNWDMMAKLTYVPPANMQECWPIVRAGLEEVLQKGGGRWIPEDVYHFLKAGRAHLHLSNLGGYTSGFVVLEAVENLDGMELHIWAAWSKAGDATQAHMPELIEFAKNMKAKRLTFSSARRAWERFAESNGFAVGLTNYEMRLTA